jgi:hypothetical protein
LFLRELLDTILLRVRRNDFEIATLAKGKQRVACTATGVDAAKRGADTGVLRDKVGAAVEVAAAK